MIRHEVVYTLNVAVIDLVVIHNKRMKHYLKWMSIAQIHKENQKKQRKQKTVSTVYVNRTIYKNSVLNTKKRSEEVKKRKKKHSGKLEQNELFRIDFSI